MAGSWTCPCGRRVPSAISTCRCGKTRDDARPSTAARPRAPTAAAGVGAADPSRAWVGKVLAFVAVVAVYFGTRGCNRYLASREARGAAVEALGAVMEPAEARTLVERYHQACFDEHYKTGWGRRGKSSFDTEKYATCMVRRAESEMNKARLAAFTAARHSPPAAPTPASSPTPATAIATPGAGSGVVGRVFIGDVKLLGFAREPQLTVRVSFMAVGGAEALRQSVLCSYSIDCGGQPQGPSGGPMTTSCPLTIDGARGMGELHVALASPAPPDEPCRLSLALTDGTQLRSNTTLVPLSVEKTAPPATPTPGDRLY